MHFPHVIKSLKMVRKSSADVVTQRCYQGTWTLSGFCSSSAIFAFIFIKMDIRWLFYVHVCSMSSSPEEKGKERVVGSIPFYQEKNGFSRSPTH